MAEGGARPGARLRRGLAAAAGRRAVLGAGAALLAAAALALLLGDGGDSGAGATAGSSARGVATGTVERRTLAERLTATGTIGYAGETTVLARLSGTVTELPAVGEVIRRGERLYGLAGEPVLLLYGSVPAYRPLAEGMSGGPDVEQLERNLAALGYSPGSVDEDFTASTAAAVAAWQEDLDLEATGELELGRVAFLRGPQRVTRLDATLGEALGGGAAASAGLVAWHPQAQRLDEAEEAAEPKQRDPGPADEGKRQAEEGSKPGPEAGKREGGDGPASEQGTEQPRPGPEQEEEATPEREPEAEPPSVPVLQTSSTRRVVSVELEADQQSIAHRGQRVVVVLPGGAKVPGEVRGLAAVAARGGEGGPGAEPQAAAEATISLTGKHRIPALDGATVNVLFTQRVRRHVLSVPLTALVAIGGGRFAVRVSGAGGNRQIVVTPGLAADGYVEVAGKGLRAGMTVETGG
ncbi:MAG TPA: peptidoglycan-binding protein [Solirubrobacterales bacterium]|nr:peptidoglycan-binding protein [Solirubrobacterales bacterium]